MTKDLRYILRTTASLMSLIFKFSRARFLIMYSVFTADSFFGILSIFALQKLFEVLQEYSRGSRTVKDVIIVLLAAFIIYVSHQVLNGVDNFLGETSDFRIKGKLTDLLNEKVSIRNEIDFETPSMLDIISSAYESIPYSVRMYNTITDILVYYIPYYIFVMLYLYMQRPILSLVLIFVFIPNIISQHYRINTFQTSENELANKERQLKHFRDAIYDRNIAKETISMGRSPYFIKLIKETIMSANKIKYSNEKKAVIRELTAQTFSIIGYACILWLLYDSASRGLISIGAFAAIYASTETLFNSISGLMMSRIGDNFKHFGKLNNYFEIINYEPENKDIGVNAEYAISLRNVSFSYPETGRKILSNISINISRGEKIGIVGLNGSGKSTLAKVLSGVYQPTDGKAEITGWADDVGVMFQDYKKYALSLRENIAIGSVNGTNSKTLDEVEEKLAVELFISRSEKEQILGTTFGGIDLSGGQWQKLSMERAMYKDSDIVLFDEPTAAIDPIFENKLFSDLFRYSVRKTLIIVTHKLASIRSMDRIIVLKDGKIIGLDSHEKLLVNCPHYHELWQSQAGHYI